MPPDSTGKIIPLTPQGLPSERKLRFVCLESQCPNTCCGPFHGTRALESALTQADLGALLGESAETIAQAQTVPIFAEIRLTSEDVARLQNAGHDDLIVRRQAGEETAHYMRLGADGSCAALSAHKHCTIHPHRPTICRAFPFYIDLFAGLSMIASCPGVGAGEQTVRELEPEIRAAVTMYEYWLTRIRQTAK